VSQENVEALKSVYARWAIGDFWTPAIFDPDVEVLWAKPMPDAKRTVRGLPELTAGMRNFLAAWDDYRWEADEFIAVQGGRVLVLLTARGRGKGSSVDVQARWAQLWTFHQGKATRLEGFIDQAEALKAAGLEE
jgi:ketosteroid isomerase-like protein